MLAWIVTLAIETAMRQSEILNLRLQDVDMENRVVRLAYSKNNSARTIPLSPAATASFHDGLIGTTRQHLRESVAALFLN